MSKKMHMINLSLKLEEKIWLEEQANFQKITLEQVIHQAIHYWHESLLVQENVDIIPILYQTYGIGFRQEGLQYQRFMRDEWGQQS